ncbi:MAG: hypothetical protein SVZ03_00060 [Spirochaetota bacterium]|nr:hypothetical protein [Spirochaetota bacterium]
MEEKENHNQTIDEVTSKRKDEPNRIIVGEEATELLNNENIINAVNNYKADTKEKVIALEFIKSHIQFINQIVENDIKKGISRRDIEVQDIVSHINMMMQKREEYIFTSIIINSPSHYKCIMKDMLQKPRTQKT